jgi:hypothetical protein
MAKSSPPALVIQTHLEESWFSSTLHNDVEKMRIQDQGHIIASPLFNVTRKPVAKIIREEAQIVKPTPIRIETAPAAKRETPQLQKPLLPSLADFKLLGVMVSDDLRQAVVQTGEANTVETVKEGESVLGWSVTGIKVDRIVLSHGEERRFFQLFSVNEPLSKDEKNNLPKNNLNNQSERTRPKNIRLRTVR